MAEPTADFSFDLYPGLDRELQEIYDRNVASGVISAEVTATSGLQAAIGITLPEKSTGVSLSPETKAWADRELDLDVIYNWYRYHDNVNVRLDVSPFLAFEQTAEGTAVGVDIEHFSQKIEKLFLAKQTLEGSGEVTPSGENIGESMHLVAIPWKAFRDNMHRLPDFVKSMRDCQAEHFGGDDGVADDYFNDSLVKAIQDGTPMYRNPIAGHVYTTTNSMPVAPDWISATEYLDYRIRKDGDWGLMLVQTSREAGIKRLVDGPAEQRSPNALTNNGQDEFMLADQNVGQMGIFEWLSLTLQAEDPSGLSPQDAGWMLANRLDVNGAPCVPCGSWGVVRVGSYLYGADDRGGDARPRLAVM